MTLCKGLSCEKSGSIKIVLALGMSGRKYALLLLVIAERVDRDG